jgi:hypothetical protein
MSIQCLIRNLHLVVRNRPMPQLKRRSFMIVTAAWLTIGPPAAAGQEAKQETAKLATNPAEAEFEKVVIRPRKIEPADVAIKLLPPAEQIVSGNAMLDYFMAGTYSYRQYYQSDPERSKRRHKWLETPFDELPIEEIRKEMGESSYSTRLIVEGAKKSYADSHYLERIRRSGAETLLGEIETLRDVMRDLHLQAQVMIRRSDFDKALELLRSAFAVSRHVSAMSGDIPFRVSANQARYSTDLLRRIVTSPDSPNLYWAVAQLPRPLLQTDKLMETELLTWNSSIEPGYFDRPLSEAEANEIFDRWSLIGFSMNILVDPATEEWRKSRAKFVQQLYPIALEHLKKQGDRTSDKLAAMPKSQVCMIFFREIWTKDFVRFARWGQFEPWVVFARVAQEKKPENDPFAEIRQKLPKFPWRDKDAKPFEANPFSTEHGEQFAMANAALIAGLETRLNVLMILESLRDYAVDHSELPESLDALTRYPLKLTDNFTGRPIRYRRIDAKTARIEAGPPEHMPGYSNTNQLRYEIRLVK